MNQGSCSVAPSSGEAFRRGRRTLHQKPTFAALGQSMAPTNLLASFEIIPNLKIDALLVTNSGPDGLTFSWRFNSTVRVEGTSDLLTWPPVAYALGSAPTTTWTSSIPLNNYGNYFRLGLVATEHRPELLTDAGTNGPTSPPP